MDAEQYTLTKNGDAIGVEPMVFDLLLHFVQHPGQVFSMDELMQSVWKGRIVSDATISSRIKSARQALGDSGGTQRYIQTVRGRGFRFNDAVALDNYPLRETATRETSTREISLLIQPLHTLAAKGLPQETGDIVSAELATILNRIPLLAIRFDGEIQNDGNITSGAPPRELYESLGVDYLLTGRVHALSGRIKCNVQLVDARSGFQIWASNLEVDPAEALWMTRLIHSLVARLEPQILQAIVETVRSADGVPTAAQRYLEATGILSQHGWNRDSFHSTFQALQESCSLDPRLAVAPALLSLMYAISYRVGILYSPESESHALENAERAMQLDSMNSTVLGYTGCALADIGQVQRALPILRHAVELNPVNAQAWSALGSACMLDKNVEEAIRYLRHGMEISPLNKWLSLWGSLLSLCLMAADDLEGADEEAQLACQRDDRLYLPRVVLSGIRLRSRNRQGARAALDEARRIKPDLSTREVKFLLGDTLGTLVSRTLGL